MKAIQITKNGDASVLQLQNLPKPKPAADEVLIRIKAVGLNFVDIYMREGRYATTLPYIPGFEAAGIIEEIGKDVTEFKIGDRVAYTNVVGSYAEYNVVKAQNLISLPEDISFEQGAAFPLQGITAHYLLHEYYQIKPNDHVLVHAAAGGMGLLLVQWLKHMGAIVIGTVSTEEKAKMAQEAGADHVILYTKQDFVAETKKITDGKGVDYIIDGVGKTTFLKDLEAVRIRGHICHYGSASGPADPIAPSLLQAKSLTLSTGSVFHYLNSREELLYRANAVLNGIREGWLKLRIDHTFPLEQAAEAHQTLENRKTIGKIILTIAN